MPDDTFSTVLFAAVVIGVTILGLVMQHVLKGRCPRCRQFRVFRPTGEKRGLFSGRQHEYLCQQCGHRAWKRLYASSGGGGDSAGDGGGGDSAGDGGGD